MTTLTATYGQIKVEFTISGDLGLWPFSKIRETAADVIKSEYADTPFEEQDFIDNVVICTESGKIIN